MLIIDWGILEPRFKRIADELEKTYIKPEYIPWALIQQWSDHNEWHKIDQWFVSSLDNAKIVKEVLEAPHFANMICRLCGWIRHVRGDDIAWYMECSRQLHNHIRSQHVHS